MNTKVTTSKQAANDVEFTKRFGAGDEASRNEALTPDEIADRILRDIEWEKASRPVNRWWAGYQKLNLIKPEKSD
ncbi:MAG: hypothetical protein CBC09_07190 [Cellvibrionales bacterium TMED49]|nr:hypothetical protein [Porticoccaceae bacterium]OUU37166.1 MAG: hypothetical protein CBC09_07190 [Cellvibrionales bacterium TMED49]